MQSVVAVLALTPVLVGAWGIVRGPTFLNLEPPWPIDLDSHFRFLCGVFLVVGIAWYSCIPAIERKGERFRLLAAMTFVGGLARLHSLLLVGPPSAGHIAGLTVELVIVPLLVAWQMSLARRSLEVTAQKATN